jgi:single-strand DNA-binding protein
VSEGLNRVMLLGNLGADPELRMTTSGKAVLNMRLATTETYLDQNKVKQEKTEWHSLVLWGRRAEALGKILSKGDRIFVEGGLQTRSYDDRDGQKRYKTEVNVTNVVLNGKRNGGGGGSSAPAPSGDDGGGESDNDIPF